MKPPNKKMLEGPLFSGIILYAIPLMLTSVLQLLFNAADLAIVGRFCGSVSVAAVGATGSVSYLIVSWFMGLSVGAGVMVAHALGGNDSEGVHRTVHTALPIALVCGAVLTVVGILFSETMLRMMSTPENVLPLSAQYMRIYFCGTAFTMVYNYCASILRAAGDTKSPLLFLGIAGVVNVVLNVVFVTAFHMNVAGVALATVISQGISAVLVVIALMRRTDACRLDLRKIRFYKAQTLRMLRIGLPAGIQGSMFSISNVIIQSSINSFGDAFMSGNTAAANIEGFLNVVVSALHQSALNFIGQNVGAKQYKRVGRIYAVCMGCGLVSAVVLGLAVNLFGTPLLSIYITDSPEAISYGLVRLAINCLPYFLFAFMDVTSGALRGLGASFVPMVISLIGTCGIRVVWIYTIFQIPAFHTPECLYLSYPISWGITFFFHAAAFFIMYRRHAKALP